MNDKLKAAGIRAIHTIAQTAIGVVGASLLVGDVNWIAVVSSSILSGVASMVKSFVVGCPESPTVNSDGEEINSGYDGEDGK